MVMVNEGWSSDLRKPRDHWTEFHHAIIISSKCVQTASSHLTCFSSVYLPLFTQHDSLLIKWFFNFHNIQHHLAIFYDFHSDLLVFTMCVMTDIQLADFLFLIFCYNILYIHRRNKDSIYLKILTCSYLSSHL